MESPPSLETVYEALQALFSNPDVTGKEKASVWLGELQRSVHAWQIADQLLTHHQSMESCYFAAQTMRSKIQYAFHELPANVHESLRDSLLEHAGKVTADTNPAIVTQLCLALADLALQMVTWKGATNDLVAKYGNSITTMHFLLELLTVLPEEISSRSLRLGANRRREVIDELKESSGVVLQLLCSCLKGMSSDPRIQVKVFRCLGTWFSVDALPQEAVVQSGLLMAPFKALVAKDCTSTIHEAASDCICSALYCVEEIEKHQLMAEGLYQAVLTLPDAYHISVSEEDIDKSLNYCRIFTELAESFLEVIVETPNQGLGDFKVLELLLMCIGHYQYEVAEVTFNFWHKLSEELYQRNKTDLNDIFKPYVQRLIIALCSHCQMDPDHEGVPDENDDFYEFRMRVSELIKDVVFIVGSSTCFTHMFSALQSQTSEASWDMSEASLYVMSAVARNLLPDENDLVPQVVQAVLSIPSSAHVAVRYTTLQLIGELCEWIDKHPQVIDPVLQFLLAGLQEPRLSSVSAQALQSIASTCRDHMKSHFHGLIQIAEAMDTFNLSSEAAIGLLKGDAKKKKEMPKRRKKKVEEEDGQQKSKKKRANATSTSPASSAETLTLSVDGSPTDEIDSHCNIGVSTILARLPNEELKDGMKKLCSFQVNPLSKLVSEEAPVPIKQGSAADPTVWLDRLAAIFRHTIPTIYNGQIHPCQTVIQELWPVLSDACSKYQSDNRIIERCCRCIRFAVRCLGKSSLPLLNPLVTQMVSLYQVHPHSCFLYLGSILVDEYGADSECIKGLLDMLQAFCGPTFKLLEEQNGLRNHPDTVDDLFRLSLRFIQRSPLTFLQSNMVKSILCCAIAACSLDHKDANSSVMKFITEFIRAATSKDENDDFETRSTLVKGLLHEQGQALVHSLIHSCVFCLPTYMAVDLGEVVYEIMLLDRPTFCVWLEAVLKALPTENSGGAVTATHKQLTDFHKAVTSAEKVSEVGNAMRDFARLYR